MVYDTKLKDMKAIKVRICQKKKRKKKKCLQNVDITRKKTALKFIKKIQTVNKKPWLVNF